MNYIIVKASSAGSLEIKVVFLIEKGFKPVGGVSVRGYQVGSTDYLQAMIKE